MVSFEERFEALARLHGAQGIENCAGLTYLSSESAASALGLPRRCVEAPSAFALN